VPATPETPASPETPEHPAESPETGYESDAEAGEDTPAEYPAGGEASPVAPYPVANGTEPIVPAPSGTGAAQPSGSAGAGYPPVQVGNSAAGIKAAGLFTAMGAIAAFFL